jgi:hypothetical protein
MYFIFLNNEVRACKPSELVSIKFRIGGLHWSLLPTDELQHLLCFNV